MESLLEEILTVTHHLRIHNTAQETSPGFGSYRYMYTMSPFCRLPGSRMWDCVLCDLALTQNFGSAREVSNFLYEIHLQWGSPSPNKHADIIHDLIFG